MATGRNNKIVGQTGEYLVAAELSRRGLIATTFTGNVPHYDIIASDEQGKHVSVQVKATTGSSWQFDVSKFCDVKFVDKKQYLRKPKPCPVQRLVIVFVQLREYGSDQFYILNWNELRNIVIKHHESVLEKFKNQRPKKWDSPHCAISSEALKPYLNNWQIVKDNLK